MCGQFSKILLSLCKFPGKCIICTGRAWTRAGQSSTDQQSTVLADARAAIFFKETMFASTGFMLKTLLGSGLKIFFPYTSSSKGSASWKTQYPFHIQKAGCAQTPQTYLRGRWSTRAGFKHQICWLSVLERSPSSNQATSAQDSAAFSSPNGQSANERVVSVKGYVENFASRSFTTSDL